MKTQEFYDYLTENQDKFYRLAFSYMKNEPDALDVVQDAICKGLNAFKNIKNKESIATWFYRIIVNTAIDQLRKHKKETPSNGMEYGEGITDIYASNYDDLQQALAKLPEKYQTVIFLRYFEDLKMEDIALITDTNVNTVKTRLYSALKNLHIDLAEEKELLI